MGPVGPDGKNLKQWTSGAHTDRRLASGLLRQYSLISDSDDSFGRRIAVLRGHEGRGGSEEIHSLVLVAGEPEIRGEKNRLGLDQGECARFLAGGIGTTPIHSMVQKAERNSSALQLIYGGRSLEPMVPVEELPRAGIREVRLVSRHKQVHRDFVNVIDAASVESLIHRCGPEGVPVAVEECCGTLEVEVSERIPLERFSGPAPTGFDDLDGIGESLEFQIGRRRWRCVLTVPRDKTFFRQFARCFQECRSLAKRVVAERLKGRFLRVRGAMGIRSLPLPGGRNAR